MIPPAGNEAFNVNWHGGVKHVSVNALLDIRVFVLLDVFVDIF